MPVDPSGATIAEKTIPEHVRNSELHIVKREKAGDLLCRPRTGEFSRPD
jgi:hypothetical protein